MILNQNGTLQKKKHKRLLNGNGTFYLAEVDQCKSAKGKEFEGQEAIITGASSGIGLAIARKFNSELI